MSDQQQLIGHLLRIKFNAMRNSIYHAGRRRVYEQRARMMNFLVVFLGAGATASLVTTVQIDILWLVVAITCISAAQLVFDFWGRAKDHQVFQLRYSQILAKLEKCIEPIPEQLAGFSAEMAILSAEEPPVLKALDAKAFNDTVDAMGMPLEERLHIPFWIKITGGIFSFEGYPFTSLSKTDNRVDNEVLDKKTS